MSINNLRSMGFGFGIASLAAACLLAPVPGLAQNQVVAGTACHSQSSGLIYTVTQVRNEQSSNRSAYCSFPIPEEAVELRVWASLRNLGTTEQTVNCTVKVGENGGGGYTTATASVVMPPGTNYAAVDMPDIARPSYWSTMGLVCTLPPKTSLDAIWLEPTFPL